MNFRFAFSPQLALLPGVDPTLSLSPEGTFDPLTALNQYQRDKYDRLREAVNALDLDDRERYWASPACLLRYLRARQWKVAKALPMFKDTIEWRYTLPAALSCSHISYFC